MTTATTRSRILLVEEDENDVLFLERAFDRAGAPRPFRVLSDGQEAIDYLLRQPVSSCVAKRCYQ